MRNTTPKSSANGDGKTSYWRAVPLLFALEDKPFQTVQEAIDCLSQEIVQITGARWRFIPSSQQETNAKTRASSLLICSVYSKRRVYGKLVVFSLDEHTPLPALSTDIAAALETIYCRVLSHVEDRLLSQEQDEQFDLPACQPLTQQEEKVLSLLAKGHNVQEIAQSLCISPETARTHKRNFYKKLHIHSKNDALKVARVLSLT